MKCSAIHIIIYFFLLIPFSYSQDQQVADTSKVNELNTRGYELRLENPQLSLKYAQKALTLAKKLNYTEGIGEANRVLGIAYYYLDRSEKAIQSYLAALTYFQQAKDPSGQAKVYNNIGNLYKEIDLNKSLKYFYKSLTLADSLDIKDLLAGLNLNIGTIQYRQKNYTQALINFKNSRILFSKIDNPIGLTQSLQNLGAIYYKLNELEKAEQLLLEANKKAKENKLYSAIASINLTLTAVFISEKRFIEAEKSLSEGVYFAEKVKNPKLRQDYLYTSYELEKGRKNHKKALGFLEQVYTLDSAAFSNNLSLRMGLLEKQYQQSEKEKENELTIARQKNNRLLFIASTIVSLLFLAVIVLLYISNQRKIRTNKQLTILNSEISQQKEELDWINQRLEKIIDERTKDLQIKNQKLSEYSWHLSHQIRSPVATMKGLMLLEKDTLISNEEFIEQMNKCLIDIDDKIININEALHNIKKEGLLDSPKE